MPKTHVLQFPLFSVYYWYFNPFKSADRFNDVHMRVIKRRSNSLIFSNKENTFWNNWRGICECALYKNMNYGCRKQSKGLKKLTFSKIFCRFLRVLKVQNGRKTAIFYQIMRLFMYQKISQNSHCFRLYRTLRIYTMSRVL